MRGTGSRRRLPIAPAANVQSCALCALGYWTIKTDFAELGPRLANPAWIRAFYAELHGHSLDAPLWDLAPVAHCHECHDVGQRTRAAGQRRTQKPGVPALPALLALHGTPDQ